MLCISSTVHNACTYMYKCSQSVGKSDMLYSRSLVLHELCVIRVQRVVYWVQSIGGGESWLSDLIVWLHATDDDACMMLSIFCGWQRPNDQLA